MRRWAKWGALLALLALLALGGAGVAAQDTGAIRVGVVVQGADELPQAFCVTLTEGANGADALRATGLDVASESGSLGTAICAIEGQGCTPPAESCFCQCEGGGGCAYWAYFHLGEGGRWQYSSVGASGYTVHEGDVEGWLWLDKTQLAAPTLPPVTFADVCGAWPRTVQDGLGRDVSLAAPPQRIASVTLASDEILLDLVTSDRLLGVTYLARDAAISNVADRLADVPRADLSGNSELLISLDADLVVMATYSNPAALDQMLAADVPVFVLAEFGSLDAIRENIRLLGRATGTEVRAEALVAQMDARIAAVQTRVAGGEPARVLYYEAGGVTYGAGSTVDEILRLAGARNVAAELGAYPLIDAEFVLAADPDVVLLGGWAAGLDDPVAWFTADPVFGGLRAVREGRVYAVNQAHLTAVSHYAALGVEDVARAVYPQAFAEGCAP